jgi:hypothetical protein
VIRQSVFARCLVAFAIVSASCPTTGLLAEQPRALPDPSPIPAARQQVWHAVVAALREQGSSEQQLPRFGDIDLPGSLPALAGRTLRVSSACWDAGPRRTQFRLECGAPGQCLPFLVYVHDPVHDAARNAVRSDVRNDVRSDVRKDVHDSASAGQQAASCRPASAWRPARDTSPKASPQRMSSPTLRAGERATAVLLADHLRMTANVTCIDPGREGQIIRVRGPDGHVFRARISGPGKLDALPR